MNRKCCILAISLVFIFGCTNNVKKQEKAEVSTTVVTLVPGIDKIQDQELKKVFLDFKNSESPKDEYKYLSKNYLEEFYPDITNAQEYEKYLNSVNEDPVESKLTGVVDCKKINENTYHIDIVTEGQDSPGSDLITKVRTRSIFIKENGTWKYEGRVPGIFEVIK